MKAARGAVAFGAGLVFALGLGVAGMTKPSKVLGFLDVAGDWDASLAFVMAAALAVFGVVARVARRRSRPVFDARFFLPEQTRIDAPLVVGAILFGVGWGLSGYCPGPAVVASVTLARDTVLFTAAMLVGIAVYGVAARWARR